MVAAFSLLILFSLTSAVSSHAGEKDAKNGTDAGVCARGLYAWSELEEELVVDPRSLMSPSAMVEAKLRKLSETHDLPLNMMRVHMPNSRHRGE